MPEDERSAMLRFALRFTLAALLAVTPALAASPDQIHDLLSYLKTFE
jgi:hypothetical protein